ncbi:MAG: TetR/AcrR family transcriptional regulator [Myxococcota bacterium]
MEGLLDATAAGLVEEGFGSLTTTRIAARAGVGVGTLYEYFPGKEALVATLAARLVARREAALTATLEGSGSLSRRVYRWVSAWLRHEARSPALTTVVRATMLELEGPEHLRQSLRGPEEVLRTLLRESGTYAPDVAVYLAVRSIDGVVASWLLESPERLQRPEVRNGLVQLVLSVLASEQAA